jgi:hypothetical protein
MGRGRRAARGLIAAAALLTGSAAAAPTLPILDARWLAPGTLAEGLARQPAECLRRPDGAAARRSVAIGRAAFRTPLLLGGQAARAGLSCAACHRNGRGNPDFLFPGLSGGPGTADVTTSVMSRSRGDGAHNPMPIPDLAGHPSTLKVPQDPAGGALERFIRGLVVDEFDGPEPSPAVLRGLADYVRALGPGPCTRGDEPITLEARLAEVETAVALAHTADPATRFLLLGAARTGLGTIYARFQRPGLERRREEMRAADRELEAIRAGGGDLRAWWMQWTDRKRRLLADGDRSLFNPRRLREALAQ